MTHFWLKEVGEWEWGRIHPHRSGRPLISTPTHLPDRPCQISRAPGRSPALESREGDRPTQNAWTGSGRWKCGHVGIRFTLFVPACHIRNDVYQLYWITDQTPFFSQMPKLNMTSCLLTYGINPGQNSSKLLRLIGNFRRLWLVSMNHLQAPHDVVWWRTYIHTYIILSWYIHTCEVAWHRTCIIIIIP